MNRATAAHADYGVPTTDSYQALQEARRRRAAAGYVPGESIRRKMAEPIAGTAIDERLLWRRAGIPAREWGMSFQEASPRAAGELGVEWKARAQLNGAICVPSWFRDAYDWMSTWEPGQGSVWLSGPVGVGKSLLAACAAMRLLSRPVGLRFNERDGVTGIERTAPVPVLWTNERSLYRDEKATQRFGARGPESFAARAIGVRVLVIDDFLATEAGAKKGDISELWEWVIGERYNEERPCIWTSNLDQDAIEGVHGARMADRIAEMTARYSLTIQGPSWRSS